VHLPPRNTSFVPAQLKQLELPPSEQDAQDESHDLQVPEEESKYSVLAQVVTQRLAEVRIGLAAGQVKHWLNPAPEQEAQSG
jgi:hypothetical protein